MALIDWAQTCITLLFYFFPAGVANAVPLVASKIPYLREWTYPMDAYGTFRGKRLLGDHKTVRGLVSGVIASTTVVYLFRWWYAHDAPLREVITLDYLSYHPLVLGPLLAIGALGGDAIKSFFKRQFGIDSGKPWIPFDQIDYIVGTIIFTIWYTPFTPPEYLILFFIGIVAHVLANVLGWLIGVKEVPY
ncbi:MAG: hypothetical protein UZ21_OP11001000506 [Microgenomates bacterium OLB22]|nr:MAG: hypothetical protein UZ21_OP11001000506 [Microgenomates bacterium OLB22]